MNGSKALRVDASTTDLTGKIEDIPLPLSTSCTVKFDLTKVATRVRLQVMYWNGSSYSALTTFDYLTDGTFTSVFTSHSTATMYRFRYIITDPSAPGKYYTIDNFTLSYNDTCKQVVCGKEDQYRFGFNGMLKDNEASGAGNTYSAEYWEYDGRLGRRFNVDALFKDFESPYACFANNPINIVDYDGADTIPINAINASLAGLENAQDKIKQLSEQIKVHEAGIKELKNLIEKNDVWSTAGIFGGAGGILSGIISQAALYFDGAYDRLESYEKELEALKEDFSTAVNGFNNLLADFKNRLNEADAINFGAGVFATKAIAGKMHLGNLKAIGNFALYEIEIDGFHYKFGIANANDKLKTNVNVTDVNGTAHQFKAGTIRRAYVQARGVLKVHSDVNIKVIAEYQNVTKAYIRTQETNKIHEEAAKRGWYGDGNSAHSKGKKKLGNYKPRYR